MQAARKKHLNVLRVFVTDNPILVILIASIILSVLFVPNFVSAFNLRNLLLQTTDIVLVAIGVTFVVLNGGIDFSCTSVLALGSVVGAYIMTSSPVAGSPLAIPVAVVAMVVVGAVIGAVNGVAVVKLKMPSFIATLGTMMISSGIAVWFTSLVSERPSISGLPTEFFILGGGGGNVLVPVIICTVAILFAHWLLTYTLFGRRLYAVGTNPKAAFVSGIPVKKTVFTIMLISGLYAGLGSIIATARNQAGLPSLGDKVFIDIIASIIIGGTSVFGGSGSVIKTVYGVLFITLMNNVINLLGIDWTVITLVKGMLVLIAAIVDLFSRRLEGTALPRTLFGITLKRETS